MTKHFVDLHGKNPWQIFQENLRNCTISAIKKTDKINYFQFTFQGSKNTANKKTRQNILSKKAAKLKKKPYRIGYNPFKQGNLLKILFSVFFFKKCTNLRKQRDKTFCRSFRRR